MSTNPELTYPYKVKRLIIVLMFDSQNLMIKQSGLSGLARWPPVDLARRPASVGFAITGIKRSTKMKSARSLRGEAPGRSRLYHAEGWRSSQAVPGGDLDLPLAIPPGLRTGPSCLDWRRGRRRPSGGSGGPKSGNPPPSAT